MSYFVGQEIKLRGKIIGHSHSFSGGNDKYMILIKPGLVVEIDKPVLESIAIGEEQSDRMKDCKLSNKIPKYEFSVDNLNFEPLSSEVSHDISTPEMVTIPKSEYELLIEIKDYFIGGDE